MYLMRIALRNLFRRRNRTLVIASILTLAVVFFLLMESLMISMMDVTFGNVIDFETPHIQIGRAEFFAEIDKGNILPLKETFTPGDDTLAAVKEREGFVSLTPVLDFSADFIAGRYEFPVRVRSIDPDSFGEVFKNEEFVIEGEFVAPGDQGIVIGDRLAEFFSLEVGDFYTLRFQDRRSSFNTMQGEVRGIVSAPHPEMNMNTVFVARDQAVPALGLEGDKVSQVMVRMENREQAVTQASKLSDRLGGSALEVRSYRDAAEFLVSMETWGYIETYFILALFLLVGAIGIISAIVLAAIERVEEIGMMKAMGLKDGEIVRVFLIEAGGIGAIGGLIGCILGGVLVFLFEVYGISMEAFFDFGELGLPLGDRLYGALNPPSFIMIFAFVVVIAVVASIIPAYWAARKDPVEAIHHR